MIRFSICLILLLLLLAGCEQQRYKIGDCVQSPDSTATWKIREVGDTSYQTVNLQSGGNEDLQISKTWIKADCPSL